MIDELYKTAISLKNQLMELLPELLLALFVLILGYLFARVVKYLIVRLVRYTNRIINQKFEQINIEQSAPYIGMGFFWFIMLATFILITDLLGLTVFTQGLETIFIYTPNILAATVIVFVAMVFGKFIAKTIATIATQIGFRYGNSLGKITQYLIIFSAIIIAIDQLGIEVTFLIQMMNITMAAVFFAAAFAFGLGAKTSVSNILASFYVRKIFKEGDSIRIGDVEGVIARIDATVVKVDTDTGQFFIPAKSFNEMQSVLIKKQ
ncbi:Mechanosensitive ion channel [Saccharicrinis carchari]|uniref:Mechanosensitive ion channel n=1 Tax=Saccharicrinis carchari TaxID=1168039 RepID=A0A521CIG8_SACCC|nr:mechanosensitive ion channel domain-containing protein [Saccharicrinis carchari]SMO58490.1 Mechanosensitive ion channel [Saccharicrinis carchari]